MQLKNNYKILPFILVFFSLFSFFLGFYLDENSAGGGSYLGDWKIAWPNLQLVLNNDILTAINHEDYYSNRTPLLYILHKIFNPFAASEVGYRRSVFFISLAVPVLFYFWSPVPAVISRFHGQYLGSKNAEKSPKNDTKNADYNGVLGVFSLDS